MCNILNVNSNSFSEGVDKNSKYSKINVEFFLIEYTFLALSYLRIKYIKYKSIYEIKTNHGGKDNLQEIQ